ncbi:MAG TPA: hypothetical protein VFG63_08470 [Nocardioidaceae bacterium]|nr:hypothetical protein [Nocardioidaceae bacterium]
MAQPDTAGQVTHTDAVAAKLAALRDEMRSTISQVDDLQAKAMLETGAEVLGGLRQAFVDYAEGSEEAWQR